MPVPEFVTALREAVGSDHLLWLPGVNAVVTSPEGHVLLQRRSEDRLWSVLSGIVEPGEPPTRAVVREVYEETGVTVQIERLTSVTVSPPRRHANGDMAQYLELTFRCRCVSDAAAARVNDDESLDIRWFARDMLPELEPLIFQRVRHALSGEDHVMFADSTGTPV